MKIRNPQKRKLALRRRRQARVRAKVYGTSSRPRLAVFRSAKHIVAQMINDEAGRTLVAASDRDIKERPTKGKVSVAEAVGVLVATRAQRAGITTVVFDRGGYAYHGRVKAVADGARSGGLIF